MKGLKSWRLTGCKVLMGLGILFFVKSSFAMVQTTSGKVYLTDDFNGEKLDSNLWISYTPENISVRDGFVRITTKKGENASGIFTKDSYDHRQPLYLSFKTRWSGTDLPRRFIVTPTGLSRASWEYIGSNGAVSSGAASWIAMYMDPHNEWVNAWTVEVSDTQWHRIDIAILPIPGETNMVSYSLWFDNIQVARRLPMQTLEKDVQVCISGYEDGSQWPYFVDFDMFYMGTAPQSGTCRETGVVLSTQPAGNHFFVDNANPRASDANPGDKDRPWKTLGRACATALAGDTVTIKGGIYREQMVLKNSGQIGQPVTFEGENGKDVVIKGSEVLAGFQPEGSDLWVKREWKPNWTWEDAVKKFLAQNPRKEAMPQLFFVDEKPLRCVSSRKELVPGSFTWNSADSELVICPEKPMENFNQHLVEVPWRIWLLSISAQLWGPSKQEIEDAPSYITIHNLQFRHSVGAWSIGGVTVTGKGWVLEDNRMEHMHENGLVFYNCSEIVARGNVVNHNGFTGFLGSRAYHILLEDNTNNFNNTLWRPDANKFMPADHVTIRRHTANFNHGCGIWFDTDAHDIVIEDSVFVGNDNFAGALFYEISQGPALFQNNLFFGNDGGNAGSYGGAITLSTSNGVRVIGNTFVNCDEGVSFVTTSEGMPPLKGRDRGDATWLAYDNTVEGNLFFNNRVSAVQGTPDASFPVLRNIVRSNVIFLTPGSYIAEWSGVKYKTLSEFEGNHPFNVGYNRLVTNWEELGTPGDPNFPYRLRLENMFVQTLKSCLPSEFKDVEPSRHNIMWWYRLSNLILKDVWYLGNNNWTVGYWLNVAPGFREAYDGVAKSSLPTGEPVLIVYAAKEQVTQLLCPTTLPEKPIRIWSGMIQDWCEAELNGNILNLTLTGGVNIIRGLPADAKPSDNFVKVVTELNGVPTSTALANDAMEIVVNVNNPSDKTVDCQVIFPGLLEKDAMRFTLAAGESKVLRHPLVADPAIFPTNVRVRIQEITVSLPVNVKIITAERIPNLNGGLTLDGQTGKYNARQPFTLTSLEQVVPDIKDGITTTNWTGPQDLNGKVYLAWNNRQLYLLIDVTDDVINPAKVAVPYDGDSVEVFLDTRRNGLGDPIYGAGVIHLFLPAPVSSAWQDATLVSNYNFSERPLVRGMKTSEGYRLEMALPWVNFAGFQALAGQIIGFDVAINDADVKPSRHTQMVWHGTGDNWRDPSAFGRLRLE